MNILTLEAISKSYGMKPLFKEINFSVHEGDKIGLIGVNGTGKSTLLQVIAGLIPPDAGQIMKSNQLVLEYLPQNPEFNTSINVLDYVYYGDSAIAKTVHEYEKNLQLLEANQENEQLQKKLQECIAKMDQIDAWEWETQAKSILTKLNISQFSKSVQELSGGQKKRVALARTLIHAADLLILDEPTNHIDHHTVEWLEEYLARFKGALILITHDRYFLDRVVNRIVELDQGYLYSYKGNYSYFLEQKANRIEQLAATEDKRQNLLRRELAWLRRGAKARTTKQKARIDRIRDIQAKEIDLKEEQLDFSALGSSRLGKKVLEMEGLSKELNGNVLFKDFSYIVVPGDRIGIIGKNGSGKSTLLNILAGKLEPDKGQVQRGETVRLSYYDQESMNLDLGMKVIEYIKEGAEVIYGADGSILTASQMLERFLFPPTIQWSTISTLSGGEKRRLYLLRKLMEAPNVLLLDEPTNDLDIQTLTILEDYLDHFAGSVIIVSHDRYFLDQTVDHLFCFEEDGTLSHFMGNYSEYLALKKEEDQRVKAEKAEEKSQSVKPIEKNSQQAKPRKLSFKEQKEFEQIEDKIFALEQRNEELTEQIEQAGSDYTALQQFTEEQNKVQGELEQLVERWAELSSIAEGNS
ncbi:ABC transporter ATP-binding protein [Caldalkalibacillus mannanilyticus]|uniref:ABC transporter ATP-binding protein n=1 Tax=Caldalkalibacillus mannanilyticus TaxID=1418 RepID=UPI0004682303|nr:ABC-F family ATP-binding cassette domain-containing protein [Caldalkalibacillus mannanilyticus]